MDKLNQFNVNRNRLLFINFPHQFLFLDCSIFSFTFIFILGKPFLFTSAVDQFFSHFTLFFFHPYPFKFAPLIMQIIRDLKAKKNDDHEDGEWAAKIWATNQNAKSKPWKQKKRRREKWKKVKMQNKLKVAQVTFISSWRNKHNWRED